MATSTPQPSDLESKLQAAQEHILGQPGEIKTLSQKAVKKLADTLNDPASSFLDAYRKVGQLLAEEISDDDTTQAATKKEEIETKIKLRIIHALESHEDALAQLYTEKQKELAARKDLWAGVAANGTAIDTDLAEEMGWDELVTAELRQDIVNKHKRAVRAARRNHQSIPAAPDPDPTDLEYERAITKMIKDFLEGKHGSQAQRLAQAKRTEIISKLYDADEAETALKSEQQATIKNLQNLLAIIGVTVAADDADDRAATARPASVQDVLDQEAAGLKAAREKERKEKNTAEKAREADLNVDDPKDLVVKEVSEITSFADIRKCESRWSAICNRYGKKPKQGNDLFWAPAGTRRLEKISADEAGRKISDSYWDFRSFMESGKTQIATIEAEIARVSINPAGLEEEAFSATTTAATEKIISRIETLPVHEKVLFLYQFGVDDDVGAFQKIENIFRLRTISTPRKGKNIYEESLDAEGKVETVTLREFLEQHETYGQRMVAFSQRILGELYERFGKETNLPTFRNALIEIIKCRGQRAVPAVADKKTAQQIYTSFLVGLDPNMGEKEVLSLLIAFRDRPPYVIDLTNTTNGWRAGQNKKTHNVHEDFSIDGSIYRELRDAVQLDGPSFNEFVIKIAPVFELLRSAVKDKLHKAEELKLEEINPRLKGTVLAEKDLQAFLKLTGVPLWASKLGHAYKHALYLNQDGDCKIPMMKELQGPDSVEKLNVLFVNVEEKIRRIAERLADERLDQELKETGVQGWKQFFRIDRMAAKFWKRNAAEGYRQKYTEEYIRRIKSQPQYRAELMQLDRAVRPTVKSSIWSGAVPASGTIIDINQELDQIAHRFGISWAVNDAGSYLTSGTERESMENSLDDAAIQTAIRDLCRLFAENSIDENTFRSRFNAEVLPLIQATQNPPDSAVISFLTESNIRTAESIEKAGLLDRLRAHRDGLIALDIDNMAIDIRVGQARNVDVKTEVKSLSWTDRLSRGLVEGLQKNRFLGRFFTPTTTAIMGYGLANITTQALTGRAVRMGSIAALGSSLAFAPLWAPAIAGIAAGSLVGGAFGALRQNKETLRLKAMKERRDAMGYRPEDDTKGLPPVLSRDRFERRLELSGGIYHKVPIDTLILNITGTDLYDAKIHRIAEAIALTELSEHGISADRPERLDLIKFSRNETDVRHGRLDSFETNMEAKRLELANTISQGKRQLREIANPNGLDFETNMLEAVLDAKTRIIRQIESSERKFQTFKRGENLRAAGLEATIGGITGVVAAGISSLLSAETVPPHLINLTPKGGVNLRALDAELASAGLNKAAIADIHSHLLQVNPVNHQVTPEAVRYISDKYGLTITGEIIPQTVNVADTVLFGGKPANQAQLIDELKSHGLSPEKIKYNAAGTLDLARMKGDMDALGISVEEHTTLVPAQPLSHEGGWDQISKLHFNHDPSAPQNHHILDELRFTFGEKAQMDTDGTYHFQIRDMFNTTLTHTQLPGGVSMPADPSQMKIGLQMDVEGKHIWKFFTPDSNGEIKLPAEFIDQSKIGYVPKGSDTLPGLKTSALAVGFDDSHGTYQVMASIRGNGTYSPDAASSVEYFGKIKSMTGVPGKEVLNLSKTVLGERTVVAAPLMGVPERHLEYDSAEKKVKNQKKKTIDGKKQAN